MSICHGAPAELVPRQEPDGHWEYQGCFTDSVAARTLGHVGITDGGPSNMTPENCMNACFSQGYVYAGVEYSAECWCDNELRNGGGPAPDGEAQCTMPCNGDPEQMCGGPDRLNLYHYVTGAATGTDTATSTTAAETSSTAEPTNTESTTATSEVSRTEGPTSTSPTGVGSCVPRTSSSPSTETATLPNPTESSSTMTTGGVAALPTGWDYAGCYVDNLNGRIMANQQPDSASLTPESCVSICADLGYVVAGMEFSSQCFCDNYVRTDAPLVDDTDCYMTCSGDPNQKCGAPDRMSVYSNGDLIVLPNPAPQTGGLPGSWEYRGCLQ